MHFTILTAICLFLLLTNACTKIVPGPTPSDAAPVTTNRYPLNGAEIYVESRGKGMPIIILHGGPGFDHHHLSQMNVLSDQYRLIYYDQRGSGDSDGEISPASITMENFVDDLEALRLMLGLDKINLLGASFGGLVALYYGIHYPEHLNSLVLIGSVPAALRDFENVGATIEQRTHPDDRIKRSEIAASPAFKLKDPETIENYFRIFFKAYLHNPALTDNIDLTFGKNTIQNMDRINELMYQNLGDFDIYKHLPVIRCPTLILHGDQDPFPYQSAEKIHQHITNSKYIVYEQTGHFLYIETPQQLFSELKNFYENL